VPENWSECFGVEKNLTPDIYSSYYNDGATTGNSVSTILCNSSFNL